MKRADDANNSDWPAMFAVDELDFKRNGNRTILKACASVAGVKNQFATVPGGGHGKWTPKKTGATNLTH